MTSLGDVPIHEIRGGVEGGDSYRLRPVESSAVAPALTFETHPSQYRHWKLTFDGAVATLVDGRARGRRPPDDYRLKLNSYDLGVDIELADAIQRIRFEHPEVRAVVITSLKERIFCAGANIFMLARLDATRSR